MRVYMLMACFGACVGITTAGLAATFLAGVVAAPLAPALAAAVLAFAGLAGGIGAFLSTWAIEAGSLTVSGLVRAVGAVWKRVEARCDAAGRAIGEKADAVGRAVAAKADAVAQETGRTVAAGATAAVAAIRRTNRRIDAWLDTLGLNLSAATRAAVGVVVGGVIAWATPTGAALLGVALVAAYATVVGQELASTEPTAPAGAPVAEDKHGTCAAPSANEGAPHGDDATSPARQPEAT